MEKLEENNPEYEYALKIHALGVLPGPSLSICRNKIFIIQKYKQN